jgi:hypothetical protein
MAVRRERRDVSGILAGNFPETHFGSSCRSLSAASQPRSLAASPGGDPLRPSPDICPSSPVSLRCSCAESPVCCSSHKERACCCDGYHDQAANGTRQGCNIALQRECAQSRGVSLGNYQHLGCSLCRDRRVPACKRPQSINPRQDESQQSAGAS